MEEKRFSDGLKEVIAISRTIAIEFKHDFIGIEHLLLSIIRDSNSGSWLKDKDFSGLHLLKFLAIPVKNIEREVVSVLREYNSVQGEIKENSSIPLTKTLEKVLKNSYNEAIIVSAPEISIGVLLLAIFKELENPSRLSERLKKVNLDYKKAVKAFKNINIRSISYEANVASKQFTIPAKSLSLYFDLDEFDAHEISEIIYELSVLYESIGGDKLEIKGMENLEFVRALLPA